MFNVTLQCGETTAEITVPNEQTELRYLQKDICRSFKQNFPWQTATLQVGDTKYDELFHTPFAAGPPDHVCTVTFEGTTDMYWVDYFFRERKGPGLEEEMGGERRPLPAI